MLLSAYRRDDYAAPKGFVAQLGAVLEKYPTQVVEVITSPITGLQRRLKFPPSIAEVVEACDAEAARMRVVGQAPVKIKHEPRQPVAKANVFVRAALPELYGKMIDRARDAPAGDYFMSDEPPGIWVPYSWLPNMRGQ